MLRVDVEWTVHEHQWVTDRSGSEKLVMNKYDATFLLLLIGAAQREVREEARECSRLS